MANGPINWSAFRVHFFKDAFEQLVEVHGNRLDWVSSAWCPNFIANDEDQHSIDCPTCGDANGIMYYGDDVRIKAVMQSIDLKDVYRAEGRFDLGTTIVTTPSDVDLQIWDKLTVVDSTERYRELVTRNTQTLTDKPRYFVHGINTVQTPEKEYILNEDFNLVNGEIVWASDTLAPADDDIYTVDYIHHPIYIVVEMPNEIRDHLTLNHPLASPDNAVFEHLPKRVMAKRDFLLRDESTDTRA